VALLSLIRRYGLVAAIATIAVGGAVVAFSMLQIAWNIGSLSKLYHPDPVRDIKHPRFSPDESKLAFSVCNPCKITICSIADQKAIVLSPPKGSTVFDATFNPKSDGVAFVISRQVSNGDWDYQIATSQINGSGLKVLTSSDTQKRAPIYAFDGSRILFEGKERCPRDRAQYCGADAYEFDLGTNQERRLTDLRALQIAPASYLPGNDKIALTAYGSIYSRGHSYASRLDVEAMYGDKQRVFVVDLSEPGKLISTNTGTPTATSPMALPSGEIAFLARVNSYDDVKAGYVYDVFINGPSGSRRHTKMSRYIRGFGISGSAKSVAFVVETPEKPAKAELLIWSAGTGRSEALQCNKSVDERVLAP
jgi:hypothetical protein